ncbi:MAG: protein-glutamate O-methyltransferase CheR [bacterium]|nr:protein-glutamate O-methyltransferase CheR [bacterium]
MTAESSREFQFTDRDFSEIRSLVIERTGISLSDMKRDMVYARLARRLRKLGLHSFSEYLPLVERREGDEATTFINAITTNLTSFFRENHHFEELSKVILPELMQAGNQERRIRIWSAGCSSGPEPYSIAMVLRETIPASPRWDVKILATDLDTDILATAKKGVYVLDKLDGVSAERRRRFFWKGRGSNAGTARAAPELRELIQFRQLNLMESWPMRGPFDVIFCRNVIIYFDKPTQERLFDRYADLLPVGGKLILGHSESMTGSNKRFEFRGRNIYRRVA